MFLTLIFLNGCFQSTALIGPGLTIASTGNVVQAGFQFEVNKAIKNKTGKDALILVKDAVEKDQKQKKFHKNLKIMVEKRVKNFQKNLLVN